MFTANQLVAHLVGDYILQSDWMAQYKASDNKAAAIHALTYTLPFLLITQSVLALSFICISHFLIDRFALAKYVVFAKNYSYPGAPDWQECNGTGYAAEKPLWLTVWLFIIADNTLHIICNGLAIYLFA